MNKISTSSKIVAAVVGFSLALSIFGAVAVSTASAQAMTLSQLVDLFISLGIISSDKAAAAKSAVASSVAVSFTRDLTVGSSGADVTALQGAIGVSPATGYFGSLTKAAVMKYQASKGISATGYVGPLTRAALNGSVTTTTTTTTTTGTTVVNSGVEGTLTVEKTSISNSTVYEGDSMHAIFGIKAQAKVSDINLQRIKLNLGASTSFYTKVFKTLYVTDDSGKVLVQADLNSNTVVKDSGSYYITLGGFSYNIPKDSTKYLWVKADAYSAIKVADQTSRTITLEGDGVRGTDGAGIDQYSPAGSLSQTVSVTGSLADSATLDLSVNSANFKASDVVAKDGTNNNELDKLSLLAFDIRANKADVKVTDLNVTISGSTSDATTTTIYLYDGSTLLQSESVDTTGSNAGKATFNDISNLIVSKDSTKTLTVKADVRSANANATTISATVSSTGFLAENLSGTTATVSGTATGEGMVVRNIGATFALVGTPTMTRQAISSLDATGAATSTGIANFTVNVTALGGDVVFGTTGSTTNLFGGATTATSSTTWLAVYRNGSSAGALASVTAATTNAVINYSMPSSGVTDNGNNTFTLSKNNSVQIPVTVQFTIAGGSSNSYAVQINGFRWSNATVGQATSASMLNKSEWRTPAVSLP